MGLKALSACELAGGVRDVILDARRQGDVGDFPAADADQVVVVPGQILGKFEPGELVIGRDPADQPCGLKIGQVPVGGAARQAGKPGGDIADTDGVAGADKHADYRPAPAGVPLVDAAQPSFHHAVQVTGWILGWHWPPHKVPGHHVPRGCRAPWGPPCVQPVRNSSLPRLPQLYWPGLAVPRGALGGNAMPRDLPHVI